MGFGCTVNISTKQKTIYLAHGSNHKGHGNQLQDILERVGFKVINPFSYDATAKKPTKQWNDKPLLREDDKFCQEIVEKDLKHIYVADILVAMVDEPSVGTSMEIFYAYIVNKPIYILTKIINPWLSVHGKIFRNADDLLEGLQNE